MQRKKNGWYSRDGSFCDGGKKIAWVIMAAVCCLIICALFGLKEDPAEQPEPQLITSTRYRYEAEFANTLKKYPLFESLCQQEKSMAIPGLENTSFGDSGSDQMVPQGICIAGDYLLISAYDKEKRNPSVLYVVSFYGGEQPEEPQLLTTIVLPDKNHVGGIAFDGENIWIAKSTTGWISMISLETVKMAVESGMDSYRVTDYEENMYSGVTASFLTWYGECLWVGTYCRTGRGTLTGFHVIKGETGYKMLRACTLFISPCAQGASFLPDGDRTWLLVTASSGRYNDSVVHLYEVEEDEGNLSLLEKNKYGFPPMAENIVSDQTYTYFMFESAATCYSTGKYQKCRYPVDRICAIANQALIINKED